MVIPSSLGHHRAPDCPPIKGALAQGLFVEVRDIFAVSIFLPGCDGLEGEWTLRGNALAVRRLRRRCRTSATAAAAIATLTFNVAHLIGCWVRAGNTHAAGFTLCLTPTPAHPNTVPSLIQPHSRFVPQDPCSPLTTAQTQTL